MGKYKCDNSKCKQCCFFGTQTFSCDYYLRTKVRRGMPIEKCTRFFPRALIQKKTENIIGHKHCSSGCWQAIYIYPCKTKSGRIFNAGDILHALPPKEFINGKWISPSKPFTNKELITASITTIPNDYGELIARYYAEHSNYSKHS